MEGLTLQQPENQRQHEKANAGLEDLPAPDRSRDLAYVVKSSWLSEYIDSVLADRSIHIDVVLLPVRSLAEVAASRAVQERQAMHAHTPALNRQGRPVGTLVRMPVTEFRARMILIEHSPSVVTRSDLSTAVLHRPFRPKDRSIDNLLSRICKMIEHRTHGMPVIRSVRGQGYMFTGLDLKYDHASDLPGSIEGEAAEANPCQRVFTKNENPLAVF